MNLQEIIGSIFLILGLIYGFFFLKSIFQRTDVSISNHGCNNAAETPGINRGNSFQIPDSSISNDVHTDSAETPGINRGNSFQIPDGSNYEVKKLTALSQSEGSLPLLMLLEGLVFFFCTIGISDFLLNTIVIKKCKLSEDRYIPANLIAATIVPGSIIAFSYLKSDNIIDSLTLLMFMLCLSIGSFVGSKVAGSMNSAQIKKVIGICLIFSMIALVVKIIVSKGATGTADGLSGIKLAILCVLCLAIGFINMMGVPMKPTTTAVLLLLGMSPITTLTMVLVLGVLTPICGGINVVKANTYNKKMVLAAITSGTVFSILGVLLAISLNPLTLNIILFIVMAIAIYTIFKPAK